MNKKLIPIVFVYFLLSCIVNFTNFKISCYYTNTGIKIVVLPVTKKQINIYNLYTDDSLTNEKKLHNVQ